MQAKDKTITLHGAVWMSVDDENFGGKGRIALLAQIAECGSITQAAKAIKMSYKAAWDAIDSMNNMAGEPLVERLTGGKGGGGTRLTLRGTQLVNNFKIIEKEHRDFMVQLSQQATNIADDFLLIRKLTMKTSARNQYLGKVTQIKLGSVNDEIELEIAGGHKIIAIITHESTESLGLQIGVEAFALIKSSSIILMTEAHDAKISARNQLTGTVIRVQAGAVNTEIVIELAGGGSVAAIITNESCAMLGVDIGMQATGIFKASSVILGMTS